MGIPDYTRCRLSDDDSSRALTTVTTGVCSVQCALCTPKIIAMELGLGAKNCKNAHSTPLEAFSVFWLIAQHETTERSGGGCSHDVVRATDCQLHATTQGDKIAKQPL